MKRATSIVLVAGLALALPISTAEAGKPVDIDKDGYSSVLDCDDNDGSVWQLNSCGQCAQEPVQG